jgi:hypothetical protein
MRPCSFITSSGAAIELPTSTFPAALLPCMTPSIASSDDDDDDSPPTPPPPTPDTDTAVLAAGKAASGAAPAWIASGLDDAVAEEGKAARRLWTLASALKSM